MKFLIALAITFSSFSALASTVAVETEDDNHILYRTDFQNINETVKAPYYSSEIRITNSSVHPIQVLRLRIYTSIKYSDNNEITIVKDLPRQFTIAGAEVYGETASATVWTGYIQDIPANVGNRTKFWAEVTYTDRLDVVHQDVSKTYEIID